MKRLLMLCMYLIIAAATLALLACFAGPRLIWENKPSGALNIWIVDKTVPVPDYREHKGLTWLLNHYKIINKQTGQAFDFKSDYYGFFPVSKQTYQVRELPAAVQNPDMIYLTDTYGVYTDDYLTPNVRGTRSDLIYGGLKKEELASIVANLGKGNILIGEFNIGSAPTNAEDRSALEQVFGIQWAGWKGRYFKELSREVEIPVWLAENYEKQTKQQWNFMGEGYVLVSDNDEVIVLEAGKHVGRKGLYLSFQGEYAEEFDIHQQIPYQYWFEFIQPSADSEVLARYSMDLTAEGQKRLEQLGLKAEFPAVVRRAEGQFTSYYFAGDYADMEEISGFYKYYGFDRLKQITTSFSKQIPDYFYWNCYAPMMKKIILDASDREGLKDIQEDQGIRYMAKVEGKDFYIYADGKWQKKFLKGVNIGAGKPGAFPGELAITKEEYLRWFKQISDMNAEVIRVYTTLNPDFYDALSVYNKTAAKPLYLLQGVWLEEEDIAELMDPYADNGRIINRFIMDAKILTDIIHGDAVLPPKAGHASGTYKSDVSQYVIGWILGIEWDPEFVESTNQLHPEKSSYKGKYLYTEGSSPFEAFLCKAGDEVIQYEIMKYNMARPVSYSNWPTTDMLKHPNEPYEKEDMAVVNPEHIRADDKFKQGVFASYHIYPYYPDFMNYQKEYISFKDEAGKIDTYKAYLRDLMQQHTMPVLVAEFGVPASRGKAHDNLYMGYDQGNHDEVRQGEILQSLLKDIVDEGYCGSLVFTWQDEWFKRTWNTMDFDLPDSRPYWSNTQTNEQQFGILAFDPGKDESVCYIDGDIGEWKGQTPVYKNEQLKLYVKSDEKYVYLMAESDHFDFEKDELILPIDSIPEQGNGSIAQSRIRFSKPAEFLIQIKGRESSRITIDAYYDSFYYLYAENLKMLKQNAAYRKKGSGIFNPMYLCLSREFTLPQDKIKVPFSKYETGLLKYGNGNPKSAEYNSLADFCAGKDNIEIRIPWQLLNMMDPSTKAAMGDFYENKGIKPKTITGFNIGAGILKHTEGSLEIAMGYYYWEPWKEPLYHERLKRSYDILKEAYSRIR